VLLWLCVGVCSRVGVGEMLESPDNIRSGNHLHIRYKYAHTEHVIIPVTMGVLLFSGQRFGPRTDR